MDITENDLNNNLETITEKLEEAQKSFLETDIGKIVNSAIDIGLKTVLPDLIEDQVIDIKNTIFEQGFKEGLNEVINKGIDMGKSAIGIVTGEFENISQVQTAIKKGGILDSISSLLDVSINFAKSKNLITSDIASLIKKGKNSVVTAISDKLEDSITNQIKSIENLETYCQNWNKAYEEQDFSSMEKAYKNIQTNLNKVVPFENTINEARKIENIHNLIKNNGNDFNISELEIELAGKL